MPQHAPAHHGECQNNTNPLVLAEALCVPCITDTARKTKTNTPTRMITDAWRLQELALATSDPAQHTQAAQQSNRLAQSVIDEDSENVKERIRAHLLYGYRDAFEDRWTLGFGTATSEKAIHEANRGAGAALFEYAQRPHPNNLGFAGEALAFYLMSRPGTDPVHFLFPASTRENRSSWSSLNHDAYLPWQRQSGALDKLPFPFEIAAQSSRKSTLSDKPPLKQIRFSQVFSPMREEIGERKPLHTLIDLGVAEWRSGGACLYDETVLDFAGHCLSSALSTYTYNLALAEIRPAQTHLRNGSESILPTSSTAFRSA